MNIVVYGKDASIDTSVYTDLYPGSTVNYIQTLSDIINVAEMKRAIAYMTSSISLLLHHNLTIISSNMILDYANADVTYDILYMHNYLDRCSMYTNFYENSDVKLYRTYSPHSLFCCAISLLGTTKILSVLEKEESRIGLKIADIYMNEGVSNGDLIAYTSAMNIAIPIVESESISNIYENRCMSSKYELNEIDKLPPYNSYKMIFIWILVIFIFVIVCTYVLYRYILNIDPELIRNRKNDISLSKH